MLLNYISYFRSLAIAHQDILHDPLSDSDTPSGEKHFTRISLEEVIKGMQSQVAFPCLCLELYENETESQNPIYIKSQPHGAFMVIDHPASDTFNAEQDCYEKTEKIVYEILQKIYKDHKPGTDICNRPFKSFSFDKLIITPVGPVFTGQFGYRVEFAFELQNQTDITQPPPSGTFTT